MAAQNSFQAALVALQQGRADDVLRLAASAPERADWLTLRALALGQLGRATDALPLFERLVLLEPAVGEHWSNLGNCLCELGREAAALAPLERALALGTADAGTHFALARACTTLGRHETALEHLAHAIALAPDEAEFRILRARLLLARDDWDGANAEIDRLRRGALAPAQALAIGELLAELGLGADAAALFERVLAREPGNTRALLALAVHAERTNRLDAARAYRQRITTPPDSETLRLDARLAQRAGDPSRAAELLEALLAQPALDPGARSSAGFELGQALDRAGRVDDAIAAFAAAHAARPAASADAGRELLRILDVPPAAPAATAAPDARLDPVFVVGFPRSGTTLLEQLLDAHAGLVSFDEQPLLQRQIQRMEQRGARYPEALASHDATRLGVLRAAYFADLARILPRADARRAVDKNPLNLVRLPLIAALFSRARVVFALRHPCDVVLSCHMQSFRAPLLAESFRTVAGAAALYDRVMTHATQSRAALPLALHALRYEDWVADTEAHARALFAFLELPWDDALLRFTERARERGAISTPSYAAVAEPVNRAAVGRWRRYRALFDARTLELLAPWCERFGYAL